MAGGRTRSQAVGGLVIIGCLAAMVAGVRWLPLGRSSDVAQPSEATTTRPFSAGPADERLGGAERRAARVLRAWDRRRADAYATADVVALRRLYVPGSLVGTRDSDRLAEYADRGLVVEGMRMRLLAVDVVRHDPRRLLLHVEDRLVSATAASHTDPDVRRRLPTDRPSTHVVMLVRRWGRWLVATVR